jgi:hypothetical protein
VAKERREVQSSRELWKQKVEWSEAILFMTRSKFPCLKHTVETNHLPKLEKEMINTNNQ